MSITQANLKTASQPLREENLCLMEQSGSYMSEEIFKRDNTKVGFYTGIPSLKLWMTYLNAFLHT